MRLLAHGKDDRPGNLSRLTAVAFLVCCGSLAVLPLATCLLLHAEFVHIANESIAYRYFSVARLWNGTPRAVLLPQGFLTSDLQHVIFWCLDRVAGLPAEDLRSRLNVFALGTLAINAFGIVVLFILAIRDGLLRWSDRFLLTLVAFVPVYGTASLGFTFATLPDYLATNVTLATLCVYLFLRVWRNQGEGGRVAEATFTGVFAGVVTANKISMVIIAFFPLSAVILVSCTSLGQILLRSAFGLLGFAVGLLTVVGGFYLFDFGALYAVLPKWFEFASAPGDEPFFWNALRRSLRTYNVNMIATYALVSFLFSWTTFLVTDKSNWRKLALLGGTFGGAALCWLAVVKRPALTTLFEAAVFLLALSVIAILVSSEGKVLWRYALLSVSIWGVVCTSTFPWQSIAQEIRVSSLRGERTWRRHAEIREWASGRPVIFVLPDNFFTASTVEELLLKGTSVFPTWQLAPTAKWILDLYFPGLSFRSEHESPPPPGSHPGDSYPGNALLMWMDLTGSPTITQRYAGMTEALGRDGVTCRRWPIEATHILNACELPPHILRTTRPSWPVSPASAS